MTVRVGVIGTGWVAQDRHIRAFRRHREAELVTVFDRKPERASQVAERMRIPHWSADMEEFLGSGLDAVSIATPPWTHAELAAAALERGIHVFTEKPMAMSLAEARGMVDAATKAGRLLCVSHNFLFSRAVEKARRFLGDDPGIQYAAAVQLSSLRRRLPDWYRDLPGGLFFDESPHLLYMLQDFLGAPLQVDHVRGRRGPGGSEIEALEVLLTGSRASGQMTMVFGAPVSEWQVVLTAKRGVVALDLFRDIAIRLRPDGAHLPRDILRTSARALAGHAFGFLTSGTRYATRRQFWGHDEIVRRFVDAVLGRGPSPVAPEESLGVVAATDRILAELGERRALR